MDDGLRVTPRVVIPERELTWRFSRSGGAGGQHVNTSDTRVELMYDVAQSTALSTTARTRALQRLQGRLVDGVLTVVASERRSQLQNREAARERLATVVREAIAPPPKTRRPTRPSRGAVEERIATKKRRGEIKRLRRSDDD